MAGNTLQTTFDKASVQQSFDAASSHYNQFTSLQRAIGDRLLAQQEIVAGVNVLDVGAGTGYLTRQLRSFAEIESLFALDISAGMLRQTRQNMSGLQLSGLICSDADNLALKNASLSAVYSNLAFQWCLNLQQLFDEAHRVLKADGAFVFSTFGPKTLCELKTAWAAADNAVHVNSFVDLQTIERHMQLAGFRDVTISSEEIMMHYETPKQLMLSLKGMGAHNINQGRNRGLTGVQAYKAMLKAYEMMRTTEGVPATFEAVYVNAKR